MPARNPDHALLATVPGIGQTLATVILLEVGPIGRFASPGNFASYARCVDSEHTSNGKKKGEGNTRNGNQYLSWAFVEAASRRHRREERAHGMGHSEIRRRLQVRTGDRMNEHYVR
jgi:transposase